MADTTLPPDGYNNDPGTLGGDASSGSGFNVNSFVDSLVSAFPGILSGTANIINAQQGHPSGYNAFGQPVYPQPYPATQQQNTVLYIGGAVVLLLLVLGAIYLISKK